MDGWGLTILSAAIPLGAAGMVWLISWGYSLTSDVKVLKRFVPEVEKKIDKLDKRQEDLIDFLLRQHSAL